MFENLPPQLPYTDRLHVQFHAAHILCNACLDHWDRMDAISRKQLRNYLFDLAIKSGAAEKGSPSFMAPSVMNKLLQAHAILWKRGWLEEATQGESYPILAKMEKIFLQALSTQAFVIIAVLGGKHTGSFARIQLQK